MDDNWQVEFSNFQGQLLMKVVGFATSVLQVVL